MGGFAPRHHEDFETVIYREHSDGRRWIAGNEPDAPRKGNRKQRRAQAAKARRNDG